MKQRLLLRDMIFRRLKTISIFNFWKKLITNYIQLFTPITETCRLEIIIYFFAFTAQEFCKKISTNGLVFICISDGNNIVHKMRFLYNA